MAVDEAIRYAGSRFIGVPGFDLASKIYPRVANPIANTIAFGDPYPQGYWTVDIDHDNLEPFELWVETGSIFYRQRVAGVYEKPVMEVVADRVDSDSVFWEVGTAAGYFSLALANTVRKVVAFDEEPFDRLNESIKRNEFSNITTVRGTVGGDVTLDDYETPDVALIDIEGWEYEALSNAPELLDSDTTLIVELHHPSGSKNFYEEADPQAVIDLLEENGYTVSEIHRRRPTNWNVLAEKP